MLFTKIINNMKNLFTKNQHNQTKENDETNLWDNLALGDRMKLYESFFTGNNFPGKYPQWPSRNVVRIPGGWPMRLDGYTDVPAGVYPVIRVDGHCCG